MNFKNMAIAALVIFTMTGCSAIQTSVKKRNLDVQTQMSETVFLDPVSLDKKTVFLQLRNTSDKQEVNVLSAVRSSIIAKGYKIVEDPSQAHYWIQANILKVGKSDLREAKGVLNNGYGSAVVGGFAGAQFGSGKGAIGMGILGATAGLIGDALVEDVMYLMITDLQISEKAKAGVIITEANKAELKQGTSGHKSVTSSEKVDRKKYQTRIVSTANKANLDFIEAKPELITGLSRSIAGIL